MRIALYEREGNARFQALAEGCQAAGYSVVWQRPGVWTSSDVRADVDAVVVHGLQGNAAPIAAAYRARGVPVWLLDLPRLRAEPDAVGLYRESLAWLPATIVRRVVVPTPPVHVSDIKNAVLLVVGQKPGDAAHGLGTQALALWTRATIADLREYADLLGIPIVYRPHPKDETALPSDAFGADRVSLPSDTPLAYELAQAACVVVYNSTVGWDAIAAVVPVIATAPRECVAYADYASFDLASTLAPQDLPTDIRAEALGRAASSQWTLDELRSGLAVRVCFGGETPEPPETPETPEIATLNERGAMPVATPVASPVATPVTSSATASTGKRRRGKTSSAVSA